MKSIGKTAIICALTSLSAHAGTMGPVVEAPRTVYLGVFGGGGASNKVNISQYGTAFFLESLDPAGPLAVDGFGRSNSRSVGMVGGQLGYQWAEVPGLFANWSLTPAFEVEGYYLGKSDFKSHLINFSNTRLDDHDFAATFPIKGGVFLINSVVNFDSTGWLHPYVGAGIGGAILSISDATAFQIAPPEIGVNHYNSNTRDSDSTFAAQVKVGSNFALSNHFSVFAEYRWLYLAPTSFTFGSTVYPGHAATSAWEAELGSQKYNMGAAGLRYTC